METEKDHMKNIQPPLYTGTGKSTQMSNFDKVHFSAKTHHGLQIFDIWMDIRSSTKWW